MIILPHCPDRGAQIVKSRLLTGRTILARLDLSPREPHGRTEVALSHARCSFISDIRYKVPSVRNYGHNGYSRSLTAGATSRKEAPSDRTKVNRGPGLDVSFSYSETPYEYLEEGNRHARRELGLTAADPHQPR